MGKIIKFLISAAVAVLIFFIGIGIVMAAGIIGIAAMIVPVILSIVAFIALQLVFRIFRFKTLLFIAVVWIVVTLIGAGVFNLLV